MIDPIQLVLIFFGFTMLFMVAIGAFVFKMQHTLEASKLTLEAIQKSSQGTWYISHDQKSTLEGVLYVLQQQNKFIKKREGALISGPLPDPNTDAIPVTATPPGKSAGGRPKKEKMAVAPLVSTDSRYADTASIPVVNRGESTS